MADDGPAVDNTTETKALPVAAATSEQKFGCEHYTRRCAFVSPCCSKVYVCRLCHDNKENHELNRKAVKDIKCLVCNTLQLVAEKCTSCDVLFGKYFCSICRLYDDKDKQQFHCDPCGLCRVGGRDNFFHCGRCDMCLPKSIRKSHRCVEKSSRANCPICMEDLHTSRTSAHIAPCGHLMHTPCYEGLLKSGNYKCPLCGESMVPMKEVWKHLDKEVENTPMPEEYRNTMMPVLCKDCHKSSMVLFHVVGMKCKHCGSYNTCGTDPSECTEPPEASANVQAPEEEGAHGEEPQLNDDMELD